MPTVNRQSVDTMYHVYLNYLMMIVQQRYAQEHHPPDNLESPWEDEAHPENYSQPREDYEDRQENIPPWEDEDQRENYPSVDDYLEEDSDEPVPLSVLLAIFHDADEELVNVDEEFVRVSEMSFMEASERLGQESNLEEQTISKHLKTRQYRTSADEDGEICVVCQSEFEDKELLATLGCGHEYHFDCIKRWLLHKNVCPICKRTAIEQERC